jgi:hypothetical protein
VGEEAEAIAAPAFSGCVECTITTRLGVEVFALGEVSLVGWYADGDNFVGLTMNEFANEWKLFQRVGGVEVQSVLTVSGTSAPGQVFGDGFEGGDLSGWSSHVP